VFWNNKEKESGLPVLIANGSMKKLLKSKVGEILTAVEW
jgi:hypothetical protein